VTGGEFITDQTDVVAVPDTVEAKFITGGIFANSVTENVADGYGEVPLGGTAVEVTKIYNINIYDESIDYITIKDNATSAPYKSTVEFTVVDNPDYAEIVELIDGNSNVTRVSGNSFVMPEGDVTLRVRYVEAGIRRVIFKIMNGTWEDGTTEDIILELIAENGVAILREADFPVGMIVNEGFTGGAWSAYVNGEREITDDLTFTYEYSEEEIVVPDTNTDNNNGGTEGSTEEDDVIIPNTGANAIDDKMGRTGSIAGVVVLLAGLVVMIGGLVHVGRNLIVGEDEE
jgi:hypothetical protein